MLISGPHDRPSMRSATNTVLVGMAACDLVTIVLPAPWHFYLYTLDQHDTVGGWISTQNIYNNINNIYTICI